MSNESPWFAVYTKSRHEKVVHASLLSQDVEAFLPLHQVLSQWKDRRVWVEKPLFPGYLFARLPWDQLWVARAVRGVVHLVGDGERPVPVPEEQVLAVREMMERPVAVDPWPYVQEGDRVLVTSGPLIGLQGFFVRWKNAAKLVISVDLLGRSVAAEVNADSVVPVEVPQVMARPCYRQADFRGSSVSAAKPAPVSDAARRGTTCRVAVAWLAVMSLLLLLPCIARALSGERPSDAAARTGPGPAAAVVVKSDLLQGQVVEPDMSTPMSGLPIALLSEETGKTTLATTDADGRFVLTGFGAGRYVLHVGAPGVEARLTAASNAGDAEVRIVMLRISAEAVPPGTPAELVPKPLPVTATRLTGRLVLVADPASCDANVGPMPKWSRPWVGRTTF